MCNCPAPLAVSRPPTTNDNRFISLRPKVVVVCQVREASVASRVHSDKLSPQALTALPVSGSRCQGLTQPSLFNPSGRSGRPQRTGAWWWVPFPAWWFLFRVLTGGTDCTWNRIEVLKVLRHPARRQRGFSHTLQGGAVPRTGAILGGVWCRLCGVMTVGS